MHGVTHGQQGESAAEMGETTANNHKRNSAEASLGDEPEDDLHDTASSPVNPSTENVKKGDADKGSAQRQLDMDAKPMEAGEEHVPPPPPSYVTPSEREKTRKVKGGS